MRYFRAYPWALQLLLFVLMVFVFMCFGTAMVQIGLQHLTNFKVDQVKNISPSSPQGLINAATIINAVLSVFSFLLPALIFSFMAHPQPMEYLGLRPAARKINYILPVGIMLGALPILLLIGELMSHINFGASIKADQAANDNMFNAMLGINSISGLVKILLITAVIVPLGEEMFFRGLMLRFARKRSHNMYFPAVFSALVFAFAHANYTGAISIFLAGLLLVAIYYLTGSLWCSIIAHAVYNGTQVVMSYFATAHKAATGVVPNDQLPFYWVIIGAVVFSASFYLLWKNRTPLPKNWTDDFTPEELSPKAH